MITKLFAVVLAAVALAAPPAAAAPVGYRGDLVPGATVTGSVSGSGWFLNDEAQTDFWQFSGAAGQVVDITGRPLGPQLDLAFSVYRGASASLSQFINNSDWSANGPDFIDFAFGSAPGQPVALSSLVLPASDVYTIAIGGFLSSAAGPFAYQLGLTVGSAVGKVPLPSTALLLAAAAIGLAGRGRSRRSRGGLPGTGPSTAASP